MVVEINLNVQLKLCFPHEDSKSNPEMACVSKIRPSILEIQPSDKT